MSSRALVQNTRDWRKLKNFIHTTPCYDRSFYRIIAIYIRDKEIAHCVCGSLICVYFCDLSSSVLQYFKLTKVIKK